MNIFFIYANALLAAQYLCDKHVVIMILETCQMLCSSFRMLMGQEILLKNVQIENNNLHNNAKQYCDNINLYRLSYSNHPMTNWVRSSKQNFYWTLCLGYYLLQEYTERYHKIHKCKEKLDILINNWSILKDKFPQEEYTIPPMCMPDKYKLNKEIITFDDVIESYRHYYIGDKSSFAKWNKSNHGKPDWYIIT